MADAFKLAITLPPNLYDSAKAEPLAPVISATYTPADYARFAKAQREQYKDVGRLTKAVRSGRSDISSAEVARMNDKLTKYHEEARKKIPVQSALPVLGRGTAGLKMKTEKLMRE